MIKENPRNTEGGRPRTDPGGAHKNEVGTGRRVSQTRGK